MNRPHKFIAPLSVSQKKELTALFRDSPKPRVRMRAHSLLLSAQGWSIKQICQLYHVHYQSVSSWLDRWAKDGLAALPDRARSGKPPSLSDTERNVAIELLRTHPHAPRQVLARLLAHTGKTISRSTLKRLARSAGLRWKRVRKTTAKEPDPEAMSISEKELTELKKTSGRSH